MTTAVHPLDLRVGQHIHFDHTLDSYGRASRVAEGPIAAKIPEAVLVEAGVTLAGTKLLILVPNDRITSVWLDPPATSARALVPVQGEPQGDRQRGGVLSRIFRDTSALQVAGDGVYSLDDDRTPWAS